MENKSDKALKEEIRTLRKKNEALLENRMLWEFALEGADIGMWYHDIESDLISLDFNAEDILGFKPKSNNEWNAKVHKDDIAKVKLLDESAITSTQTFETSYRIVTKTGDIKWILERGKSVESDKEGIPIRTAGTICDITERKNYEEQLSISHERIELALKGAHLGMWDWDLDGDSFVLDNRSLEILGHNPQNLEDWYTYIHPDDLEKIRSDDKAVIKGVSDSIDYNWRPLTGPDEVKWIHGWGKVVEWNKTGKPIRATGTMRDITERIQTEEKLRYSEKRSLAWLESSPVCTKMVDLDFNLQYMSAAGISGLGVDDITEFYGKPYPFSFYPESFRKLMTKNLEKVRDTSETIEQEGSVVDMNGNELWFHSTLVPVNDDKGQIDYIIIVSNDTTKRKQVEKALRESKKSLKQSEKHLSTLISDIPGVIYRCRNNKKWSEDYISEGANDIYGYRPDEFFGENAIDASDYIHQDDQERVWEETQIALEAKAPYSIQYRIITKDKVEKWVSDRGQGIYSDTGKLLYLQGIVADITDIKSAESERIKLEFQLRQSQKMESLGTLAGGIAHDFNNILYPIIGYAEIMQEDLPEISPHQEQIAEIMTSANRASDLVKQILTFSRQSEHEVQPLRIQIILVEVLKLIRASLPTTIKIVQNINRHCGMVMADPTHIHQVVMNLVTNSFHSMEDSGGILEVSLSEVDISVEDFVNPEMLHGKYACLTISDTGEGMDEKTVSKIYEPYYTTKRTGKGTGLGMSVVHGIVKRYNGDIQVSSEPGKGTVFKVYFPLERDKKNEVETVQACAVPKGNERILLVDDELMIVRTHTKTLERLGYRVTPHISSTSVLEIFKSSPDDFDLVITDMTMPDMTGIQLSQEILSIRPDMPIILCTGYSKQIDEEKAKALGIRGYVMKPIIKSEMAKKIREVLD